MRHGTAAMDDRDTAALEAIWNALDEGRPAEALARAREVQRELPEDDPVLRFLAGRALVEMDRPEEAAKEQRRAVELDPDDVEFRTDLAESLFLCCEFDEALVHARRAVELDDGFADAHYVLALLLERCDRTERADRHFARASRLDGERFPAPCRVEDRVFERELERARARLPESFRAHLERVSVIVEPLPSEELLREESPPLSPELLGLFAGVTIDGESYLSMGGELPPRIYLFQRNLERTVVEPAELAEQIRVTLYHELGHFLGMDEEELDDAGYG
jgi:predicted Zn-dependent protease with MMP-like domain